MDEVNKSKSYPSNYECLYLLLYLAMQVEWVKSKAHADQWDEQFVLTVEEMQHVIHYCDWKAHW